MFTQYINAAYLALNTALQSTKGPAPTRRALTEAVIPLLQGQVKLLKSEISSINRAGLPIDMEDPPQSLRKNVYELRGFLLNAESRLNDKEFKNGPAPTFGSDLKKNWMKTVFTDADDVRCICELTDATRFQSEQDQIVKTVSTASSKDGAKHMLAQSRVSLANASQGPAHQLLHVMNELSNAARYELLSKVDLYIRSGHAQNDLTTTNKATKGLRAAFAILTKKPAGSLGHSEALNSACHALYGRFDELFQSVFVKADKSGSGKVIATNHGSLAAARKDNDEGFACERVAASGYIDSVIYSVDKKTVYAGLVTANDKSLNMVSQGEQLAKQLAGLQGLATKDQTVDVTSIIRATHHSDVVRKNSAREEFFNQLSVSPTNTGFVQCLDKMQALTVLCALPNATQRCATRFLLVGKELEWNPVDYDAQNLAASAVKIIKPVIEKLTQKDFRLLANSTKDSLVNQVAQSLHYVVSQFKNTPEMQREQVFFNNAGEKLEDVVAEAQNRSNQNVSILDMETLADKLNSIKPLAVVQEQVLDAA